MQTACIAPKIRKDCLRKHFTVAKKKQRAIPHRAPLFLFVLPFASGLLTSRLLALPAGVWAAVLLLALLILLWRMPSNHKRWGGYFLASIYSLGLLCGNQFGVAPAGEEIAANPLPTLREETIEMDPVQIFLSPPHSHDFLALAEKKHQPGLYLVESPVNPSNQRVTEGSWWSFTGVGRGLSHKVRDPDFLAYLKSRGVTGFFEAVSPPEHAGISHLPLAVFAQLRLRAMEALAIGSDPTAPATRIYEALVLGQRLGLQSRQKEVFRATGTAHLFAISGLHIGLVGTFLFLFLRSLRISEPIQVCTSLVVLLFYVLLTGAAPSAVRAYLMVAFLTGAKALNRGYRAEAALAASAMVVLLIYPEQLFSLGFQLSYTVVLSILVFGVPLARELIRATDPPFIEPGKRSQAIRKPRVWVLTSLAVSVSAFLASAPISIDHFGVFPLSAVLLNLVLIPPASVVLALGFVSMVTGLIGIPFIPAILNAVARPILDGMFWITSETAALPFSSIPATFPAPWLGSTALFGFLAIAFWVGTRATFRKRYLLLPAGLVLGSFLLTRLP